MFSFTSYLVLGDSAFDIVTLTKNGLQIANCEYSFQQGVDEKGKVTTRTYAGAIQITLAQVPPLEITEWGINSRRYKDGMIVCLDSHNIPVQKIIFKNAACVSFEMNYTQTGNSYISTKLLLQAEKLLLGDGVEFDNEWTR